MSYSVLVYDDEPDLAQEWADVIKQVAPEEYHLLSTPSKREAQDAVRDILRRRTAVREGEQLTRDKCLFDDVDILIIDYDLLHIDESNAQYTGESIARLVRMFSNCGIVVVLNQFPGIHFDLSLRGHIASHADLNIDGDLLKIPGLWRSPPWDGFRPWAWQTLSKAVETQKARESLILNSLDRPIVEVLGMKLEDALRLSDSAFGFIAPEAENFSSLQKITFREFLSNKSGSRDSRALVERDPKSAVRFGAARIGKWLEREVLAPQDVLIDVPHLLQRFPFLLEERFTTIDEWNEAIHDVDRLKDIFDQSCWFEPENFLSKPAVWGQRLEADDNINRARSEFDFTSVPDFVFLEDRSVFTRFSDATEFRAGFHNSFDRRFVRPIDEYRYAPQRRFAFGI